jgi:hypothetical protein
MAATYVMTFEERVANMFTDIFVSDLVGAELKIVKMLVKERYLSIVPTEDGDMVRAYQPEEQF